MGLRTTDSSPTGGWTFIQGAVLVLSVVFLAWNVAGLIANPDFATGAAATSTPVLGVDFNGWHALTGLALFGPGVVLAWRKDWALLYAYAAILALVGSGIWALIEHRPAGILYFKNNGADAALHLGGAGAYALAVLVHFARGGQGALALHRAPTS